MNVHGLRPGRRHLRRHAAAALAPATSRPWPPTATCSSAATTGTSGWSTTWPRRSRRRTALDPREDPATLNRLYQDAVEAKHTLSARSRASIRVDYAGPVAAKCQVTREQFEEMTADLLERTAYTSRQLLAAAGLEWKDVERILLVGGSTRMPMVSRMLKQLTGHRAGPHGQSRRGGGPRRGPLRRLPAGQASAGGTRPTFQVTNVNAHSLGIEGIDTETLRKKNVILIPRNTPLPAKHTERFATKSEGQRSIVHQGAGRRELAARRVHRHRPDRDPRSAGGAAQGLADRGHLRVRDQRTAERRCRGAGHPAPRAAGTGARRGPLGRRDRPMETAHLDGRRVRRLRVGDAGSAADARLVGRAGRRRRRFRRRAGPSPGWPGRLVGCHGRLACPCRRGCRGYPGPAGRHSRARGSSDVGGHEGRLDAAAGDSRCTSALRYGGGLDATSPCRTGACAVRFRSDALCRGADPAGHARAGRSKSRRGPRRGRPAHGRPGLSRWQAPRHRPRFQA